MNPEPENDMYFIHHSADEGWVSELAQRLEKEPYHDRTLKIFFSPWDIDEGHNFVLILNNALEKARFAAVVLTPESVNSEWVQREWTSALLRDVSGSAGRVIPFLRRDCDIPFLLRVLDWVDFRNPAEYEKAYGELVQRIKGERKPRRPITPDGHSAEVMSSNVLSSVLMESILPDHVEEQLESNIFPVIGLPISWFRGQTQVGTVKEALETINESKYKIPGFIVKEKEIICLRDLRDTRNPLSQLVNRSLVREESIDYVLKDPIRQPWLMELLKKCIMVSLSGRRVAYDPEHDRFYFKANLDGTERKERWKSPTKWAERTVARSIVQDNNLLRYEHQAVYLKFIMIGNTLALLIDPTWTFTRDGRTPLLPKRMTKLAVGKMYKQNNAAVLNDTRFWVIFLANNMNEIRLPAEDQPIRISTTPFLANLPVGIEWDNTVPDITLNPLPTWDDKEEGPMDDAWGDGG